MEKTAAAWGGGGGGEDFFIQILVWLPVTSLLRFKSVCKSWRALIQTSFFINLHTTTTTTTSNSSKFGSFILQAKHCQYGHYSMNNAILVLSSESGSESGSGSGSEYGDWYWGTDGSWHKFTGGGGGGGDWRWDDTNCGWYWVSDDDDNQEVFKVNDDDDDDQLVLKLQNFGLLSCYKLFSGEVMAGSCNGLICLHDPYHRTVSLWNPATRQFRHLPKYMTIEKKLGGFDFVGFGFDVKTKDYKVVQINCFIPTTYIAHAQWQQPGFICGVYSLSTDSWRLLEGINLLPCLPMVGHHGLYLNGSCFFVGTKITTEFPRDKNPFLMLSFDFTKEIFTTMQFPDHDNRQNLVLSCLGEKLALFTTTTTTNSSLVEPGPGSYQSPSSSSYEDYDIWVWNEHGACSSVNKESWTKLYSFQIKNRGGASERTIPRGISNNGEFALIETRCLPGELKKRMQLFNLVTKEAKKDFLICDLVCRTDIYQQSLVSIIGGNDASTSSSSRSR